MNNCSVILIGVISIGFIMNKSIYPGRHWRGGSFPGREQLQEHSFLPQQVVLQAC